MDDSGPDLEIYDLLEDEYINGIPGSEDYLEDQTFTEIFQYCLKPTFAKAYGNLAQLFLVCLFFRISTQVAKFSELFYHYASTTSGLYILFVFFEGDFIYIVGVVLASYLVLKLVGFIFGTGRGYCISAVLLTYLLVSELTTLSPDVWQRIRGSQMIAAMKIISYAFDLDRSPSKKLRILNFLGYLFCPSNCIFGPWVSYDDYVACLENDVWDKSNVQRIFTGLLKSAFCFALSVCLLEWVIPDTSSQIWLYYREALSFRVGHYFVSYISETSSYIVGHLERVEVTRPLAIELPHSLVEVVIYWNLPMHRWLKSYVFKTTRPAGNFIAVMSTYLVSSLLHGLNYRLAAVLLSLGIYTYVEHSFRTEIASMFNACMGSRPCKQYCERHSNTPLNLMVHLTNIIFTVLALCHLTYLGVLMDTSNTKPKSFQNSFNEWFNVSFISHIVIGLTFLLHKFVAMFRTEDEL